MQDKQIIVYSINVQKALFFPNISQLRILNLNVQL